MRRVVFLVSVLCVLAIVAAIGYRHGEQTSAGVAMPAVPGPADANGDSLTAQAWAVNPSEHSARVEVIVTGSLQGHPTSATVYRSQDAADLLRIGWASPNHLVILEPQTAEDAGTAPGHGDPTFRCGGAGYVVVVTCETYPVGLRK